MEIVLKMEDKTRECLEKLADVLAGGIKVQQECSKLKIADIEKDNGPKKEPEEETPEETPAPEVVSDKATETPEKETQGWSYDQLKAGCHEASTLNLGAKAAELIKGKYGLSKLTELDPKHYDAFANDLRELGVRI